MITHVNGLHTLITEFKDLKEELKQEGDEDKQD